MASYSRLIVLILTIALLSSSLLIFKNNEIGVTGSDNKMSYGLEESQASFIGESVGDQSGYSASGVGDVNGDGFDDILIGAPTDDDGGNDAGQAYLILGKDYGWRMDIDLSNADASFWGENAGDWAGGSVSGVGDVNGDGYDDILVGSGLNDEGGSDAGQTYLIFGKASGWSMDTDLSNADASFWGENSGDHSGVYLSGAGDVNGDGYNDFLIGSFLNDDGGSDAGQTYLILGKATGWSMDTNLSNADASFWGENSGDRSGGSISISGDVNGDGYDDILIGAYSNDEGGGDAGQTYLVLGKATGWSMDTDLSNADASFWGENVGDYAGGSISIAGDVNGDGYDDFIIGAVFDDEGGSNAGRIYLILGKATGWSMDTDLSNADASFWGENVGDYAGDSVSGVGDVDMDGFDDILIGAPYNSEGGYQAGKVYLVKGHAKVGDMNANLSRSDAMFLGEAVSDHAGNMVTNAGDVNNDGINDLLIGVSYNDEGGGSAGQTYLIFYRSTPQAPVDLEVCLSQKGDHLSLIWKSVEYFRNLTGYNIYRSTDGNSYDIIGTAGRYETHFVDEDVIIGRTYYYKVTAISGREKESPFSIAAQALNEPDLDMDGIGDSYDRDDDGDGIIDRLDEYPEQHDGFSMMKSDVDLGVLGLDFIGESSSDNSGYSVAGAGDVNGDGYDDFIIGAYLNEGGAVGAGQTYLFFGKRSGWKPSVSLDKADASFVDETNNCWSGYSIDGVGDVNGDGYDDILIGAPQNSDGGPYSGQTFLILGRSSDWMMKQKLSNSDASFIGFQGDRSGYDVAGTGDVNGDGFDDFIIGSPYDDDGGSDAGQVYLFFGKRTGWSMDTSLANADASFIGEYAYDHAGFNINGAGDVNRDGFDDIIIGVRENDEGGTGSGQAYLILGRSGNWTMDIDLQNANASFIGEVAGDNAGRDVSGAGDVNGDGYDDILIGAYTGNYSSTQEGKVYLIFGKQTGWNNDVDLSHSDSSFIGESRWDYLGFSMDGAGDLNGDEYDDVIIGAYGNNEGGDNAGKTYVILGKPDGWEKDIDITIADGSYIGEDIGDFSGFSVGFAGDVNGDSLDEILIGAYGDDDGGISSGHTYLLNRSLVAGTIEDLSLSLLYDKVGVKIKWNCTQHNLLSSIIYRGTDPGRMSRIGISDAGIYLDLNLTAGITYFYALSMAGPFGEEGPMSNFAEIIADIDTDMDRIGNQIDWDDDGDGIADGQDAFPLNKSEWIDTDIDGLGNNIDTDDDNDGNPDLTDKDPLNPLDGIQRSVLDLNLTLEEMSTTLDEILDSLSTLSLDELSSLLNKIKGISDMESNLTRKLVEVEVNLTSRIEGMNNTLRAELASRCTAIDVRLDSMEASIQSLIESMWEDFNSTSAAQTERMIAALNSMWSGINSTFSQGASVILGRIDLSENNISRDISDLQSYIDGRLDLSEREVFDKIDDLWNGLNITISEFQSDMDDRFQDLNTDLLDDHTAIKDLIGMMKDQILMDLLVVNSTLHYHLSSIESILSEFKTEVFEEIGSIKGVLEDMSKNNTQDTAKVLNAISLTNGLIQELNDASILEIRSMMTDINSYLAGFNSTEARDRSRILEELLDRLDGLQENITTHLDQANDCLEDLEDIEEIGREMDDLQSRLRETEKATKDNGGSITVIIILLVIVLLLSLVGLGFTGFKEIRKKKE